MEDAPQEIAAVKEDLQYLISVFKRIESAEKPLGHCIAEGVRHCRIKVAVSLGSSLRVDSADDQGSDVDRRYVRGGFPVRLTKEALTYRF